MSISFVQAVPELLSEPVERWAEYYFGPPASPDTLTWEPYEGDAAYLCDIGSEENLDEAGLGAIVLRRCAELHERYAEWTPRYSAAQLSQGLWAMFSSPSDWNDLLFDDRLPFDLRARAMRALVVPYRDYVKGWNPNEAMPHGWEMLWDLILKHKSPIDLADVALGCLEEILAMDDERCQAYALHGLNHLDHPQRPAVVQRWIDAHRNRGWNVVWVEKCRDGTAM